jgi:hypothetical protein
MLAIESRLGLVAAAGIFSGIVGKGEVVTAPPVGT